MGFANLKINTKQSFESNIKKERKIDGR